MKILFCPVWLLLFSFSAAGTDLQSDSGSGFEEVRVVGARDVRDMRDVAASVEVISGRTLDDQIAGSLQDVVRYVPGVSIVEADNRFGSTEFSIRGLSGNRVVSTVDGVPVADQFDVGAFANAGHDWLIADTVSRVEVLRGPASTLFGSDALGGVVAIISRDPEEYLGHESHVESLNLRYHGADGSLSIGGALAGATDRFAYSLHAKKSGGRERESAATDDVDQLERDRSALNATTRWLIADGHNLQFRADVFDEEVDTDLHSVLGFGRRYRDTTALRGNDRRARTSLSLAYDFALDRSLFGNGSIRLFDQVSKTRQHTFETRTPAGTELALYRQFDFEVRTRGLMLDVQSRYTIGSATHQVGLGIQLQHDKYSETRRGLMIDVGTDTHTNVILGETFPLRDFPVSRVEQVSAYLHDEIEMGSVTIIPAVRYERHALQAQNDVLYAGFDAVDIDVAKWVPKVGFIWRVGEAISIYGQYAQGFRAPPFEDVNVGLDIQLFNYRAIPNPDLKAETSDGIDLGMRGRWQSVKFDVAVFAARYDDFIQSRALVGRDASTGALLFQSINIDEAEIYGAELSSEFDLARYVPGLTLLAKAAWARGRNTGSDQPLDGVDPLELVLSARWALTPRLQIQAYGTIVDTPRVAQERDGFSAPGFGIWDLVFNFKPDSKTRIDVGIFNIADKTYWRWGSVRGRAIDDPLIEVLAQPGRHFSLGIQRRLGG